MNGRLRWVCRMLPVHRSLLTLLFVGGVTCLLGLGRPAITDSDEAFYAEASREMLETGDYLTPRFNYANRFQKPILYYWLVAATYCTTGVSAGAARFPAAVAGIALAIITWWCGRRWFDEHVGLLAGSIIATSAGAVTVARASLPDFPFATFISLSIAAAFAGWFGDGAPRRWAIVLSGAAAGAAVLTKGPVGVIVPGLVIAVAVTLERRWHLVRPAHLALAAAACLAIAVPWYAAMTREHGYAYLHGFFVGDNLERFATSRYNDPRPAWFYLPVLLAGLLPWSPFVVLWAPSAWRLARKQQRPTPATVRLLIWAALPLVLFTLSVGKQPRYILPVLPPLAIALAAVIRAYLGRGDRGTRLFTIAAITTGSLIVAAGLLFLGLPAGQMGLSRPVLVVSGAATAVAGLAVVAIALGRRAWVPVAVVTAGAVLMLAAQFGILSTAGPATVEEIGAAVRRRLTGTTRWTTHGVFIRNLVFYVARRQSGPFDDAGLAAFLQSSEPSLCVIDASDLSRVERALRKRLHRVGEWRYFNPASVRAGLLLRPVLDDELRTVVLVSNRPSGQFSPSN
jgi:4-amino-4-deoxy-L-arabinose transferase-like glycosyltransferase